LCENHEFNRVIGTLDKKLKKDINTSSLSTAKLLFYPDIWSIAVVQLRGIISVFMPYNL